jgi:hypothetical protein
MAGGQDDEKLWLSPATRGVDPWRARQDSNL